MKTLLALASVLGLALAVPTREDRQTACLGAFENVPNICLKNPSGQVYFEHPSDITKFLQCDVYGRMYVIQCPAGEVFVVSSNSCQPPAIPEIPSIAAKPVLLPIVVESSRANPCTVKGQEYYPVAGDRTKFIECDLLGNPNVMNCPTHLVWEQKLLSCVYPYEAFLLGSVQGTPVAGNSVPSSSSSGQGHAVQVNTVQGNSVQGNSGINITDPNIQGVQDNPCTKTAISAGHMYFPHSEPQKFIQCDLWGEAYVMSCPIGYLWNANLVTCYDPFP